MPDSAYCLVAIDAKAADAPRARGLQPASDTLTRENMMKFRKGLLERQISNAAKSLQCQRRHDSGWYEKRIADLERQLERARTYTGNESYPCPLCTYEDGKFIEPCEMHDQIDRKDAEIERLRARLLDTSEDQGEYNDIQEVSVKDSVTAD